MPRTTGTPPAIRERAYHLWLEQGRPHGRHDEHWRRAERELIEEEVGVRERPLATAARPGAATSGTTEASVAKTAPRRAENRQDPVAAEPVGASRSRAKSQASDQSKARPQAVRSPKSAAGLATGASLAPTGGPPTLSERSEVRDRVRRAATRHARNG